MISSASGTRLRLIGPAFIASHGGMRMFAPLVVASLLAGFGANVIALCASRESLASASQRRRPRTKAASAKARIDYASFSHETHVAKQNLGCDSCHKFPSKNWQEVRKGDAAFQDVADFPEHSTCLNCHRKQFFARERPAPIICSNCHVKVTPRDTTRFLFPSLGDVSTTIQQRRAFVSEFRINFPHDKHLDVVSLNTPGSEPVAAAFARVAWQEKKESENEPKSCPVCHQTYQPQGTSDEEYVTNPPKDLGDAFWLKKGTFKTIPNSHTTCFTCHNADVGIPPAPSDCNVCHKLTPAGKVFVSDFDAQVAERMKITDQTILITWRGRISSGTFRHEGGEHPNLSCLSCHHVETLNTLDRGTFKVPVKSCGGAEGCHITATSDEGGILNYEIDERKTKAGFECTKCHVGFGKHALPENHLKAIPIAKTN